MPKFLERKLKEEYGADSKTPYKIMNSMGAMKGNKETAKGRKMESKHKADMKKKKSKPKKMYPRDVKKGNKEIPKGRGFKAKARYSRSY